MKATSVFAWLTGWVLAWVLTAAPAVAAEKVTLLLDWLPYGKHAPLWVGQERGIFRAAGIDLTIRRGFGSSDTVKRIASGDGDYGLADTGSIILGRARGAKIKMLGIFADKGLLVAYALKSSGIRTIADLKGKTIGEAVGGAALKMFPAVAATNGLKEGDWKILAMKPAAKNPSLLAKRVDAILTVHVIFPTVNAKAKQMGDELVPMLYRDNGLDIYSHGWFSQESHIASKPDQARRFMRALTESIAWVIGNPKAGMDIFLAKNLTISNREAALGEWNISEDALVTGTARRHGLGYIDLAKMKKTLETIDRYIKLKTPVRPEEVFTNEFLPGIKPPGKTS
ncbi:MAG: ABC transporter substrate-binding protein [Nitrospinota bacterium]|nr:ABC transporter substrate-binding protein [Nitrospinota bacterium]